MVVSVEILLLDIKISYSRGYKHSTSIKIVSSVPRKRHRTEIQ